MLILYPGGFTIERISTSYIRIHKLIGSLRHLPTEWNEGTKQRSNEGTKRIPELKRESGKVDKNG